MYQKKLATLISELLDDFRFEICNLSEKPHVLVEYADNSLSIFAYDEKENKLVLIPIEFKE